MRGTGKTMLGMSTSADMSWFPEPHELVPRAALGLLCSFVLKTHSWFHFVVVRYRNVSQCSANTNKSLYEMLLLFSLLGYFLGRFQGVDGRCYLTSLGVSWHLCELESRGRVVLRPIFTLMFCSTCEHSGLT